jgi:hypothetical protein
MAETTETPVEGSREGEPEEEESWRLHDRIEGG